MSKCVIIGDRITGVDNDEPISKLVELVKFLSKKYTIIFCIERDIELREKTKNWIKTHIGLKRYYLFMRPHKDTRRDDILKKDMFLKSKIKIDDVLLVLEDKKCCVDMWRNIGLKCLQVQ